MNSLPALGYPTRAMNTIRNALIDRDGTIIVEKHYLHDPAQVVLVPGAGEALAALQEAGVRLFVVTNQSGIGRGYYREEDFQAVQRRLEELLAPHGVRLRDTAFCPHAPDARCACRKPEPGLWTALRDAHALDPAETAMIGDNASDVAFGRSCGFAESVLVLTGHGRRFAARLGLPEQVADWTRLVAPDPAQPTLLARDLPGAVRALLANAGNAP
ncbi:D-glycero-beta-D-manno-heptose-1,7-bisphosphate 7-phosphatase [Fundidesulfovibrio magnetotacticus]|uniref:D,D-heptose 1,7-bisphosphate phosphatase n=1 Tax=Fundidesulfovibrio magnetotacticus TaxID=2730080 RepID=A0A6V8LRJ7_9BACT|nr:HAD family hydrolase [Fundidesulfovibrio magnetotacticus]GFK92406.1 D-glycero-beta-D-manno-heptose-1,7-bisphosphate 7-phosphatase [Fundidesulfovibrio magnetotacticus]